MKTRIIVIIGLLLITILICSFSGVADSQDAQAQGKKTDLREQTITILDDRGQYITIPYPVNHVVFLVENAMNSMYAVGGVEKISGIGPIWRPEKKEAFFHSIDPGYDDKIKINTNNGVIDMLALKQANPDLVVLWSADWNDKSTTAIRDTLKIPVYGVYYTKLSDVSRANNVFAKIIGNEARESEVSAIMGEYTRMVTDKTSSIPDDSRPTVYWMWNDIYGTAGVNSATNDLIRLAGGKNVLENADFEGKMQEHPIISGDQMKKLNPDVIYMWNNEDVDPSDIINGNGEFAEWRNIKAVKTGRVYEVSDPFIFDSFSPQQPLALMAIAKDLQPDLFNTITLDKIIDSFFVKMYNVHYPGFSPA
jgi:iron complex transport system substrate-binding protein